ncbi:MAG: flagellar biosynthesis protein FlhA [Deltaproteobacteria bacterium]|nr:flagellar biosynthesis protein FlhA [Deltaproteobacteria bacterium]
MATPNQAGTSVHIPFLSNNSEIIASIGVVGILILMVLPLPPVLLDLLLSFNITFSLTVLLVGTYLLRPLDFSSFPSVLLVATLFRLSLNIASTRIILLHGSEGAGAAGNVIKAFGAFVVGGNYVVGAIVFIVLVIINLLVITKGSGRIGEVAARFTLDAMPGKQMSIDADLNAGLIDEEEAKARRAEVSREADFYGAMDGASKFVKGDAIAGVIITLINIIGGLAIGVLQNNMGFGDAAQNYTLLTVGDGLVTQIPALMISTAAGIVVSRAGSQSALGQEVISQILNQPKALVVASAVLFGFALVPGLPALPFMVLSALAGGVAYAVFRSRKAEEEKTKVMEAAEAKTPTPERLEAVPPVDVLAMEVGYGLIPLVDVEQGGEFLERVKSIRAKLAEEIGIVIPPIHIQDNMKLAPNGYSILLRGNQVASGELMKNRLLAMNPGGSTEKIDGIPTKEPTYGLPAFWIKEKDREDALAKGYTVVDLATVLITHVSDIMSRHAHECLGRQEAQKMLDNLKVTNPKVIEELVPNLLPLGAVVRVLQNLLRERVPIRDLLTILETLADWAPAIKDPDLLTEYVRQSLRRTISSLYQSPEGDIAVLTLDHTIENSMAEALQQGDRGSLLPLEPNLAQTLITRLGQKMEKFTELNKHPVVLCSPQIRPHFKKLVERFVPDLAVLSYNEIITSAKIQSIGTVTVGDAD